VPPDAVHWVWACAVVTGAYDHVVWLKPPKLAVHPPAAFVRLHGSVMKIDEPDPPPSLDDVQPARKAAC